MNNHNDDKPNTDKPTPSHFASMRKHIDDLHHRFADDLSRRFNGLSPRTRRTVFITTGFLIAILCFKLVFSPADLKFSFGQIRPTITEKSLIDSLNIKKDTTRHNDDDL